MNPIPQIQPWIDSNEAEAVRRAVASTFVTEHSETLRFERMLAQRTGAKHVLAYANATCGLFAVLRALGVGPGDEVIVPDLTFVATANAVILAGAHPVFCDVEAQSLGLDAAKAQSLITDRTRAIIAVHLYGSAADAHNIAAVSRRFNLHFIEDAAQGLGVKLNGQHVGTFGEAGVISFYGNKTITTGEGGAILTQRDDLARRCYRLKNHGRLEKGVFMHEEIGFNFSFTEMQAALGIVQLTKLDEIIARKAQIRRHYEQRLGELEWVRFQTIPPNVSPVHWFTNMLCDDVDGLSEALAAQGIATRRFFYPLHLQPCYRNLNPAPCPVSARLYQTGLSLPSWCGIEPAQLDRVCEAIQAHGAAV